MKHAKYTQVGLKINVSSSSRVYFFASWGFDTLEWFFNSLDNAATRRQCISTTEPEMSDNTVEEGILKRFKYCLTSIHTPSLTCVNVVR